MAQAARRWVDGGARPSVPLDVSANASGRPAESPERVAAATRDAELVLRARVGD
jgi:hypothetical protein